MWNFKKFLTLAISLALPIISSAYDDWKTAWHVSGMEDCSYYPYCKCTYEEMLSGLKFNITIKALFCPASIEVNIESGKWRKL